MLIFLSLSLFLHTPKPLYKPLPHSHDSHTTTTTQTTLRQPTTIEKLFQELPCRRHRVTKSQRLSLSLSLFPPSRPKHHTSKFHPDLHSTMQQTKHRNTQRHIHKTQIHKSARKANKAFSKRLTKSAMRRQSESSVRREESKRRKKRSEAK